VFEGSRALGHVRDLSRSLPMRELTRMGMLIQSPQMLTESFEWMPVETPHA